MILFLQEGGEVHNNITRLDCTSETRGRTFECLQAGKGVAPQIRIVDNLDYDARARDLKQGGLEAQLSHPPPF